jgi:hypothetical protein
MTAATSTSTSTSSNARPPPPTSNKLDAAQRARVMRSSRKVGAVLGTTPFLLESCGSTVPVMLHRAVTQLDTSRSHSRTQLSHAKYRHRHCSIFEDARASSESLPPLLPSHTASSSKESLLSTSDSSAEADETTMPRMLAVRSLHPGVHPRPLILLNPVPRSSSDTHAPSVTHSPITSSFDIPPTPTTPVEVSRAEVRRRKMARVVRTLGENVPPELVFRRSDSEDLSEKPTSESRSSPRKLTNPKTHRPRSASVGSDAQWQRLLELPAPVFSSSSRAPEDQRWVGEWNRRNIAQVQRELRSLRHR